MFHKIVLIAEFEWLPRRQKGLIFVKLLNKLNQSRTNGPINVHLAIAQV